MKKECFLIVNPVSGGYSKNRLNFIVKKLPEKFEVKILTTAKAGDAGEFAGEICRGSENPLIAVGGGDGTINEALNGMCRSTGTGDWVPGTGKSFCQFPIPNPQSPVTLAVIPFGTANVLAKELKIFSIDDAVNKILSGNEKPLSLGVIEKNSLSAPLLNPPPPAGGGMGGGCSLSSRCFLLMAGVGFDAAVVRRVAFKGCSILKKFAFVVAGVKELFSMNSEMMTIIADGKEYACHSAFVCNASKYAGNFVLAPEANLSEPVFQIICIKDSSPLTYLKFSSALLTQSRLKPNGVLSIKASTVEIQGVKPIHIDGEFYGYSPAKISVAKSGIKIIA